MMRYIDCWVSVAKALFPQALAGEPELVETPAKPPEPAAFGFRATLTGEEQGRISILLDPAVLAASLVGEGMDQKAGWSELLREVAEAAAGELLAKTGRKCRVERFDEIDEMDGEGGAAPRGFQLKTPAGVWSVLMLDEVDPAQVEAQRPSGEAAHSDAPVVPADPTSSTGLTAGIELLLDVELEAALRFGCREMPLGQILDMGPGDVVELDRQIADPVDLIVGDKIVARGEVVLVNGNFGLRVTEVATPRKRLESIRCLF